MENKFDGRIAPSPVLAVAGTFCSITESYGSARPKTPLKTGDRGSESTLVAAAAEV